MDGRIALAPGAGLKLTAAAGYTLYTIRREVGRGGSCIVYDASYADSLGNYKLVRIKECYPHAMRLSRNADGSLTPDPRDAEAFAAARERMTEAYRKSHALFSVSSLTNAVANTCDLYRANGTVYIVSVYMNGRTFAENRGSSLRECVSLVLSTAKVLGHIHDAGYLYLDLKPENILTLEGSFDLVQLFDFDSLISMEEIASASDASALRTSFSRGYAPLEQQTGNLRRLGRYSDLFSLGAVLYDALWHRTPSAFDCDPSAEYDYSGMAYPRENYQDRLFPALTAFFRKTLASYAADRYQTAEEAAAQLSEILRLSDETKPFLRSTPLQKVPVFYGREAETAALAGLLRKNAGGTVSLWGLGGIGKSTLARQLLAARGPEWDTVVWLHDAENLAGSIADDMLVQINTLRRLKEETGQEYLNRKLQELCRLAQEQRILLVLDNFRPEQLEELKPFRTVGWTMLLISRERLPEGLFPSLHLGEMDEEALAALFEHYSGCDLSDAANDAAFRTVAGTLARHTLLTELIARQISGSRLDLPAAEAMLADTGLRDLSAEKIDYIRDQDAFHETLLKILDRLAEADRFTEQDQTCMRLLSLFHAPGIEAGLFRELTELSTLDCVNGLEAAGWVKTEDRQLSMHPLMREYMRARPWTAAAGAAADRMMRNLYERIRPAGTRHDGSRQFPEDYGSLYRLIRIIPQMIDSLGRVSEASQRLLYRWVMDAPVDQDAQVLRRMLELLRDPRYLDDAAVLRLYETAAYYRARLYAPDDAAALLAEMRQYLRKHPSAYYLSAYHSAMAVILHNADGDLKTILHHEDRAVAAARVSGHPDVKRQLTAALMQKARTLMSAETDMKQVRRLMREAEPLVRAYTRPTDYERYQFVCNAAMFHAMEGNAEAALAALEAADGIAFASPDSDLSAAEHLMEEAAPIRIALGQYAQAEEAVLRAIALCEKHPEALRYRETVFDAWYFLGRVRTMAGDYTGAEQAYAEAEKRVQDSPYAWQLPLCPEEVRFKAAEQRCENAP